MNIRKAVVTGGAGFIGKNLVESLLKEGAYVTVVDNLYSGHVENIIEGFDHQKFTFIEANCVNFNFLKIIDDVDVIFHLAANPDVRTGLTNTRVDLDNNILATFNLLENIRKSKWRGSLVFTSTSTVYGEPEQIPTPETYGPLKPISLYGASKLACESLISAYCNTFEFSSIIYRFANAVGKNSTHGVIYDLFSKLQTDNKRLEILGDGTQVKSYIYIDDCIDGILFGLNNMKENVRILNVGSEDQITVERIAGIIAEEMQCNPKLIFTNGVDGGRGWKGDVKNMLLDVSKLKSMGWRCKLNSSEAVRMAVRDLSNAQKYLIGNSSNDFVNI